MYCTLLTVTNLLFSLTKNIETESLSFVVVLIIVSTQEYSVDFAEASMYFKAPDSYLRNQLKSYGGRINYQLTYSGYDFDGITFQSVAI